MIRSKAAKAKLKEQSTTPLVSRHRSVPLVNRTQADPAGKITGMLLELSCEDLRHLLADQNGGGSRRARMPMAKALVRLRGLPMLPSYRCYRWWSRHTFARRDLLTAQPGIISN